MPVDAELYERIKEAAALVKKGASVVEGNGTFSIVLEDTLVELPTSAHTILVNLANKDEGVTHPYGGSGN